VAIERVLTPLSANLPPMAIVQHMPPHFTRAFADRLNSLCHLEVQEASDGQRLVPGLVVIAPGGLHLLLQHDAQGFFVQVKDGPPVNRHKPSVDVLFRSATHSAASKSALAIIMTGMGDDGAKGLAELRAAGVRTIAQNETTCVVYGKPKAAVELGAAERVLPLEAIPQAIVAHTEGEA
jgi:two-component system chemotaxis response regulator CheB